MMYVDTSRFLKCLLKMPSNTDLIDKESAIAEVKEYLLDRLKAE